MTPAQKKRVQEIFTPEKIIDMSKGLDNEQRQYGVILELQDKIDSLQTIVRDMKSLAMVFSSKIDSLQGRLNDINSEKDKISDKRIKNAKKRFLGLHSKARLSFVDMDYRKINGMATLYYDFDILSVGAFLQNFTFRPESSPKYETQFFYGIFIEYKIF